MRNYQTEYLVTYYLKRHRIKKTTMSDLIELIFNYKNIKVADIQEVREILRKLGYRRVTEKNGKDIEIYWIKKQSD